VEYIYVYVRIDLATHPSSVAFRPVLIQC